METEWALLRTRMSEFNGQMDRLVTPGRRPLVRALYLLDVGAAFLVYGASVSDYFACEFYKKRHCERRRFITIRGANRMFGFLNDPEGTVDVRDKSRFHQRFADLTGREYVDTVGCTRTDFAEFAQRHRAFIVKPIDGGFGLGVRMVETTTETDLGALYAELKGSRMIAEEVIRQHEELASFHPDSVNAVRVTTVLKEGRAQVVTAAAKFGNAHSITDNFFMGGILAAIEPETGIVISTGVDKDGRRYVRHPVTNRQILGFAIPQWEDVISLVGRAASRLPRVRYVGWDVALSKERGPVLVEGNDLGTLRGQQLADQVGKRPLYDSVMKGMPRLR
jgi:hypothetical protein